MPTFHRNPRKTRLVVKSSGCNGSTSFTKLSNHNPILQTTPDAMNTIKDAVINLYDLITGRDDTMKCRECEWKHGKRFGITKATVKNKVSRK